MPPQLINPQMMGFNPNMPMPAPYGGNPMRMPPPPGGMPPPPSYMPPPPMMGGIPPIRGL